MESGDTSKDGKDSVKSSSSEDSPGGSVDGEKDEKGLVQERESLNADEDKQESEDGQEGSNHKADEMSGSDSENPDKMSHSTEEELLVVEKESDSDSEKLNKMRHSIEEVLVVENKSYSDSENLNNMNIAYKADRGSGSDGDSPVELSCTAEEFLFKDKESEPGSEEPNKIGLITFKVEEVTGSDSDSLKKLSHIPEKVIVGQESVSDTEEPIHTSLAADGVRIMEKNSGLDSENMSKNRQSNEKVEGSDSDFEDPNKMSRTGEKVCTLDKESGLDSENMNKSCQSPTMIDTSFDVRVVDKDNGSDSENSYIKRHFSERTEKDGDSDPQNLNRTISITNDILAEEKEIGLYSERLNKVSQTAEEVIEVREVDPVFDGTEAPEVEARKSSSNQSLDLYPDSPSSTWPEKAAALKNLVKMKGAVAVSTVLRRLSGGKDDAEQPREEEKNVIVESSADEPVMKGRIILYTRLGCQESKEVRSFIHQKGLHFVEVNVDIYPSRKLELEQNTGSSAVPRLYLNDFVVGGLSELKTMAESGKLDEHINRLMDEEASDEAPLPPFPGEDDVSASGKMDELASIVKKMKESIVLSDRFCKLRRFNSCFVGSEAVDFLAQGQDLEREEAVNLGRKLVKGLFFRHVLDENVFEDGNHLYRFLEHDPSILTSCYNMTRGINELKPKRVTEISSCLRFLSLAIVEAYVSEDGRHIDYKSIHGCEEFRRYLRIIEELQRVELDNVSREEKLAFFINLYNMMAIHAILTWGYPNGASDRKKFQGEFKYVIGGCPYSLSAIQNGVLRGNQRPPYNISKPFGPKDLRFKVALPYVEPLVHFALVCGTKSGPPLRCYSPGNIDMELMECARNFLRNGGLLVDAETKTASASSIIRWYSMDFGKNEAEVMRHLSNYLEPSKSQDLLDLLADNLLRVTYQPYDWSENC